MERLRGTNRFCRNDILLRREAHVTRGSRSLRRWSILSVLRLLLGVMLTMSGWSWFHRADIAIYLKDNLALAFDKGAPFGFYGAFLTTVVIPNAGLFGLLVALGEFLGGISLLLGAGSRLGAAILTFQLLNYGLMGGFPGLLSHGIIIALLGITVYWESGRKTGVDRWLYERWPNAKIW